jgi:hypothetical protein
VALTIPDKGEGAHDTQSVLFQEDLDVLVAGLNGVDCVLAGCGVTSNNNMAPSVAKGAVLSNSVLFAVTAGTVTIGTADGTHPRIDLIVVDSSGAKQVRAGTAAAAPKPPARTANDVVIASVYVPASDTTIASNQIVDRRILREKGPIEIHHSTTQTNSTNTNGATTFVSVSIPDGLFLAGRQLRLRAAGIYQTNASATFTLNVAYGGTAMFTDATGNLGTNTNQGAWEIDVIVTAQADDAQRLGGRALVQTPGNKTNASVGIGDMAVVTHVACPIAGTGTVNSNNSNRSLTMTWAMNVNNVNTLVAQYWSILELM